MNELSKPDSGKAQGTILEFMLNGGMGSKIDDAGGKFLGISLRQNKLDVLLVVRADFDGRAMVAFIGASTMALAVVEMEGQLFSGGMKWRADRFAK